MFERFFMDGWWYVVKREADTRIICLKSKSEIEAKCFCERLFSEEINAEYRRVRRLWQNAFTVLGEYAQNTGLRLDRESMRQAAVMQNMGMGIVSGGLVAQRNTEAMPLNSDLGLLSDCRPNQTFWVDNQLGSTLDQNVRSLWNFRP